ncbi:MAG: aminotransferase class V-fold PLP-dependent enzyme, partial [Bacteroidota bacterium]
MIKNNFPIDTVRKDTPACQHKIHLNNAGASLQPLAVLNTMRAYFELEAMTGGYETAVLKADEIAAFYELLAQLLRTQKHNIAFATNATSAYAKALSSIPFQKGDVILTTDDDYVSNQIAFLYLVKQLGVKLIRAHKQQNGGVDVNAIEDLIQKHRPKLVAVTHVPTNSGLVQDVNAIGQICEAAGVWYLVDACQSAGQLDVNVNHIKCDFLSATFRKFLRGPRGTGFLYVSDKALQGGLTPIFPDLHGAKWTTPNTYVLNQTAKRFEYWERNYSNLLGAKAAVAYALDIGMPAIEQRVKSLSDYARTKL